MPTAELIIKLIDQTSGPERRINASLRRIQAQEERLALSKRRIAQADERIALQRMRTNSRLETDAQNRAQSIVRSNERAASSNQQLYLREQRDSRAARNAVIRDELAKKRVVAQGLRNQLLRDRVLGRGRGHRRRRVSGLLRAGQAAGIGHSGILGRGIGVGEALSGAGFGGRAALAGGIATAAGTAGVTAAAAIAASYGAASIASGVLFTNIARTAAQTERLRFGLVQIAGSQQGGAADFAAAIELSNRFGQSIQDTTEGFRKLRAAQFSREETVKIASLGADLRSIGTTDDQIKRTILAISQIKAAGFLQGDELRQLDEAGVGRAIIVNAIRKRLGGISAQEFQARQEARQISAETTIQGIEDGILKLTGTTRAGQAASRFVSENAAGASARLKATSSNFLTQIGLDAASTQQETSALNKLTPLINEFAGAFENPNTIRAYANGFSEISEILTDSKLGAAFDKLLMFGGKSFELFGPSAAAGISGFVDGLVPQLDTANGKLLELIQNNPKEGFRELGETAGTGLGKIINLLLQVVDATNSLIGNLGKIKASFDFLGFGSLGEAITTGISASNPIVGAGIQAGGLIRNLLLPDNPGAKAAAIAGSAQSVDNRKNTTVDARQTVIINGVESPSEVGDTVKGAFSQAVAFQTFTG